MPGLEKNYFAGQISSRQIPAVDAPVWLTPALMLPRTRSLWKLGDSLGCEGKGFSHMVKLIGKSPNRLQYSPTPLLAFTTIAVHKYSSYKAPQSVFSFPRLERWCYNSEVLQQVVNLTMKQLWFGLQETATVLSIPSTTSCYPQLEIYLRTGFSLMQTL